MGAFFSELLKDERRHIVPRHAQVQVQPLPSQAIEKRNPPPSPSPRHLSNHHFPCRPQEVGEEKRRVRQLTESIEMTGRQLLHLASLLGRAVEEPDKDLSLLQLDRLLRERLHQLQLERDKVLAELQRLRVRTEAGAFDWRGLWCLKGTVWV